MDASPNTFPSEPVVSGFDPIAHAFHMAKLEREKAAEFRAHLVQHAGDYAEHFAGLCERNADRLEAEARKAAALDAGDRELAHACRIAMARAENGEAA